jgi:hypothetical protein
MVRAFGATSLVALLFAPLALSGHRHATGDIGGPASCTLCVAGHQSSLSSAPPLPEIGPPRQPVAFVAAVEARPAARFQDCTRSRGPPSVFLHDVA